MPPYILQNMYSDDPNPTDSDQARMHSAGARSEMNRLFTPSVSKAPEHCQQLKPRKAHAHEDDPMTTPLVF
ncbi:hypothetical protein PGT21_026779 [Puccinia graminis f. sp. tritici]|uniref:Uncharacterized protein n=2 Tax=Puccinia graminis f. sp. tritici TaxID=56615 RepID=A0A5B0SAA8_PUCGR|nr:hypothetical protein PGT21_026779 [Puccinia graminis f. sp. tritici]KAA1135046.1 hypothetical protein PGTUg99_015115 [Puccinia graminis f. sp. tritici]